MLTRELNASLEFRNAARNFSDLFSNSDENNYKDFCDYFITSIDLIGQSELYYRQSERSGKIKNKEEEKSNLKFGKLLNDKGVKNLKTILSKSQFKTPEKEVLSPKQKKELNSELQSFRNEISYFFTKFEIKPKDVDKLNKVLDETISIMKSKGLQGTHQFIDSKLKEIVRVRKLKNRGVIDNIAWWKIVAIGAFIGLAAIAVYLCAVRRRRCSQVTAAALFTGMAIAMLVSLFC